MALPIIPLPSSTVEVNGTEVHFRSLSRSEAMKLRDMRGREDEAEVMVIAWATDCTEDEAKAFLDGTQTVEAGKLTDAILIFSGLAEGDDDPKDDMNGLSSTGE